MAVNKIGFIEQHFEKVIVGFAGAALVGVLGWQFAGGRSTVPMGAGPAVPLDQAYARVADDANRLKGELKSETPPVPDFPASAGPAEVFAQALRSPVAGRPIRLADAFEKYKVGDGIDFAAGGTEGAVVVPAVPAVGTPTAHTFLSTIAPAEVEAHPALAALLPARAPYDKAAISVEGRFDGVALQAALQAAPAAGQRALPRGWWENQTAILKVELIRQQRKPNGTWTDPAPVPPAPGREGLAPRLAELGPGADLVPILTEAWAMEDAIQRPAWYERPVVGKLTVGEEWQPPMEALAALDSDADAESVPALQRQLAAARAGLDRARKKLADISRGEPAAGGRTGQPARREGGRPPAGGAGQPAPGAANRGELVQQERLVKDAEERVKRLEARLAALGVQAKPAAPAKPASGDNKSAALLANNSVQVWNHDLTVERGQTYRYMIRVLVANPLFGKSNVGADQKDLAAQPALASADSAWTEPVRVDEETMFFFTSAQDRADGTAIGRGAQASGELYTFAWGHWRRAAVALQPGDSPSGEARVPDIDKITEMGGQAAPAGGPGGGGGGPAGGDGGGGAGGAGGGGGVKPGAPGASQETQLPTRPVRLTKDLVLLDAVAAMDTSVSIAGRSQPFVAYVVDRTGVIAIRSPEAERGSEVYRRLRASANAGEAALVLKPEIDPDAARREREQKKREEEANRPRRPAGGGGGGGGAGN